MGLGPDQMRDVFQRSADVLDQAAQVSEWDAVQAAEPEPHIIIEAGELPTKQTRAAE